MHVTQSLVNGSLLPQLSLLLFLHRLLPLPLPLPLQLQLQLPLPLPLPLPHHSIRTVANHSFHFSTSLTCTYSTPLSVMVRLRIHHPVLSLISHSHLTQLLSLHSAPSPRCSCIQITIRCSANSATSIPLPLPHSLGHIHFSHPMLIKGHHSRPHHRNWRWTKWMYLPFNHYSSRCALHGLPIQPPSSFSLRQLPSLPVQSLNQSSKHYARPYLLASSTPLPHLLPVFLSSEGSSIIGGRLCQE